MTYTSTLRTGPFVRMLLGHGLATVGQLQLIMAVGIHALAATGSGLWVSAAVSLGFLPYVLFSTSAGVLADRYSRSAVLRWSIGLRLLVLAAAITGGVLLFLPIPALFTPSGLALSATLGTLGLPRAGGGYPGVGHSRGGPSGREHPRHRRRECRLGGGPGARLGLPLLIGAPVAGERIASAAGFLAALLALGRLEPACGST